ncbi:hypothetical protein HNQ07_000926 [Deinococcus metalli]|uniref:Uncharacterized protein n=1 Tax=Deinococcus metalli TaxID=1141878 RepID=A0A7W8KC54_9DEIO|nr:hypothetical protein [Deinococcus metalli]MBB5375482.1 hypothetical protein [Deinococcus metalli]GHF28946.1 hypothetical protein GCM10017781_01140 [Deinococcus metalli]
MRKLSFLPVLLAAGLALSGCAAIQGAAGERQLSQNSFLEPVMVRPNESVVVDVPYWRALVETGDEFAPYFQALRLDANDRSGPDGRVADVSASAPWLRVQRVAAPDGVGVSMLDARIAKTVTRSEGSGRVINVQYTEVITLRFKVTVSPDAPPTPAPAEPSAADDAVSEPIFQALLASQRATPVTVTLTDGQHTSDVNLYLDIRQ